MKVINLTDIRVHSCDSYTLIWGKIKKTPNWINYNDLFTKYLKYSYNYLYSSHHIQTYHTCYIVQTVIIRDKFLIVCDQQPYNTEQMSH